MSPRYRQTASYIPRDHKGTREDGPRVKPLLDSLGSWNEMGEISTHHNSVRQ
jgi:hypothetical protein